MIISRTPFRISFFGGGTDYPAYYRDEGGAVLSAAIDKYCYITCRDYSPFFNVRFRVVWSHIECVSTIGEILHPAVREGLRYLGFTDADQLEIHYQGDLPARAGMGSSSAFSVGFINTMLAFRGQTASKHELALKAIELEQERLREQVGCQDQVSVAHGGLNVIRFNQDGTIKVEPLIIPSSRLNELQANLMLFYLGTSRHSSELAAKIIAGIPQRREQLRQLKHLVDEASSIICSDSSLDDFGKLLDETWRLKRDLCAEISNSTIDSIYQTARETGALGGKLLGAGGTGFMLFYVPQNRQTAVKKVLSNILQIPFQFEFSGSTIIHHSL